MMTGESIVILGGGSAGWMTASYLKKALRGVDIVLIESANVGTIGVGEASFSTLKLFFDYLGIDEAEWMPQCNATYKLAIKFKNWTAGGGSFYHPFQRYDVIDGNNLGEWWLHLKPNDAAFDSVCFSTPSLCENNRSPRYLDGTVFDHNVKATFDPANKIRPNAFLSNHRAQYPYGYHFEANLLASFLKKYATEIGVRCIEDDVDDVLLSIDGSIDCLRTRRNGAMKGSLYVDCTGFRGLLINQALQEPFVSFQDVLLNDRAVALQVPYPADRSDIEPFTSATALPSGWVWNIPLYTRVGTGYVYCSQFISSEQAESALRAHIGPRARDCVANHIKMRIGRCRNSWVKNCVAIGLSSGFVEPLESTGIFFIQLGIEELLRHYAGVATEREVVADYNRVMADCIDAVRDFLVLHYRASDRADTPFWRATKEIPVPPSMDQRLQLWKKRLPNERSINPCYHGFEFYSYSVMLLGLNYSPVCSLPTLRHADASAALAVFQEVEHRTRELVSRLPGHLEYLQHLRRTRNPSAMAEQSDETVA
ncbi:tryptophan halogenase family protein [Bradyrhizobium elkanii]|uniref:Tryptophan halogenase n=1 Tax=Bradyrhizobium elkanii TaxID=29448 RepID=A0A8I2CAP2_BRAEL|nr:tryptophan halogenase family protein [Bradyrhizobium elkanii]MBP1299872.1 tryptophan halogenase [Bradyrhizobium elkanii]